MVVHLHKRWFAVLTLGVVGAFMLIAYRSGVGAVLAGMLLVASVIAFRMRLVADDSGITIVNYGFPHRMTWSEIEGFRMGRSYFSSYLDVRLANRGRTRARVVTTSGAAAYSYGEANTIVAELRQRLAAAHGDDPERADARALAEALEAAERGDYDPLAELAVDQRIDPEKPGAASMSSSRRSSRTTPTSGPRASRPRAAAATPCGRVRRRSR